jgi:hypothetical protein
MATLVLSSPTGLNILARGEDLENSEDELCF